MPCVAINLIHVSTVNWPVVLNIFCTMDQMSGTGLVCWLDWTLCCLHVPESGPMLPLLKPTCRYQTLGPHDTSAWQDWGNRAPCHPCMLGLGDGGSVLPLHAGIRPCPLGLGLCHPSVLGLDPVLPSCTRIRFHGLRLRPCMHGHYFQPSGLPMGPSLPNFQTRGDPHGLNDIMLGSESGS